ncbi:MAG: hypothetical protein U0575_08595 [Phycisphaerales bacterium]
MSDPFVERALRHLRGHLSGVLRFGEHVRPLKVVVAPDGRLVAPVMVAMTQSFDTVLSLPDDNDESLHVQVTLEPFEERGPFGHLADRWRMYHGEPPDVRWALMAIDAARFEEQFLDGIGLQRPNPLAGDEARLCKAINGRRDDLRRACERTIARRLDEPVLVGVDPLGFDVRGAFEIFRLDADPPIPDGATAMRLFETMAADR